MLQPHSFWKQTIAGNHPEASPPGQPPHLKLCHHTRRNWYIYNHLPSHIALLTPRQDLWTVVIFYKYLINNYFYEESLIIYITQKKPRKQGGQNVSVHNSEQFHSAAQNFLKVPSYLRMAQSQKRFEESYSPEWRK